MEKERLFVVKQINELKKFIFFRLMAEHKLTIKLIYLI